MAKLLTPDQKRQLGGVREGCLDPSEYENYATISLFGVSDAMAVLEKHLTGDGWYLVPESSGWLCGHTVYTTKQFKYRGFAQDWTGWHAMERSNDDRHLLSRFQNDLEMAVRRELKLMEDNEKLSEEEIKKRTGVYISILSTFKDKVGQSGTQNLVTRYAVSKWGMYEPTRSLSGDNKNIECVPPLRVFSEKLRAYSYKDLLTVFDDASLELLMLALGRDLCGERGRKVKEGKIEANPRLLPVMKGFARGGKSTFTNLMSAMKKACGYKFGAIDPSSGKFGWGSVITHGGVADDLNPQEVIKYLSNPIVKMASGSAAQIFTEEKGQPGIMLAGKGVLWANVNEIDPRVHQSDPGILDRIWMISLLTIEQMKARYGKHWQEYRLQDRWANVSKEIGASPEAIMLYLFRLAIDKYLQVTGHEWVGEGQGFFQYIRENDRLEKLVDDLKSRLPFKVGAYHIDELVDRVGNLVALAVASVPSEKEYARYLEHAKKSGFEINILRKYVDILTDDDMVRPLREMIDLPSLDGESLGFLTAKRKNGDFSDNSLGTKDLAFQYSAILAGIYAQGQTYWPGKGIWAKQEYEKQWGSVKLTLEERIAAFRSKFAELEDHIIENDSKSQTIEHYREIWGFIRKILARCANR